MSWASVDKVGRLVGQHVTIKGWVYNKRSSGKVRFLLVRDGTGVIQCVLSADVVDERAFEDFDRLTQESSVEVGGTVREDRRAPGGYELLVNGLKVVQVAQHDYPITPKEHTIGFLLQHRHLWLRTPRQSAILRIRGQLVKAIRDFLDTEGFVLVDAPIFTPTSCEGTTTLFETKYFDKTAFLSQSGQLYNEAAAMALGKVYCFGPSFRAEKSKTRRHLTEFWMVEPEAAFFELEDMASVAERMIAFCIESILADRARDLELLGRDVAALEKVKPPFPRITYDDAVEALRGDGLQVEYGADFGGAEETQLSTRFETPFMVMYYPLSAKAFYMKPHPQNANLALCFDILAPEGYGEIVGGGQRIDDEALLRKRLEEHNLPLEPFKWYLDLRRYGSVPHSGFGLGIERTVAWICGIRHIREAIPFPRTIYRISP